MSKTLIPSSQVRFGAIALAIAGILFLLYPIIRPFSDEVTLQGAEAFSSSAWVAAHTLAMVAFIFLALGLLSLYLRLTSVRAGRLGFVALVLAWVGVGLTLPFYGAETFGLYAVGQTVLQQQNEALMTMVEDIRAGTGLVIFGIGLLVLAIGAIVAAVSVWQSRTLSKWSGIPLAIGLALYLPQFATPELVRIAHGALVAVGCLWLAASIWRSTAIEGGDLAR